MTLEVNVAKKPSFLSRVGGVLGSFGVPLLGGLFSAQGAKRQNRMQREMMREQMAFQERMSNTAYQRAAKDLESAGLNRILALGKPASSPGGSMAPQVDELGPAVATAMGLRRQKQELANMRAQERVANTMQAVNAHQSNSAFYKSQMDRMLYEVYQKNPWLREFAAISQAGGAAMGGVSSAVGAAKAIKDIAKRTIK